LLCFRSLWSPMFILGGPLEEVAWCLQIVRLVRSYGYGRKVVRGARPVRRELLPIHSFVPLSKLPILVGIEKLRPVY